MTENAKLLIANGFFYDVYGDKHHILYHCREYIVYKHYSTRRKRWFYTAQSIEDFEIFAEKCFTPKKVVRPMSYRTIIGDWDDEHNPTDDAGKTEDTCTC